jgi:hypothetical protein
LERMALKCSWWMVQGGPSPIKEILIFLMTFISVTSSSASPEPNYV